MNKPQEKITIQEHFKINGIVSHAYSPDGKYLAISFKSDPMIEVYQIDSDITSQSKWQLKWKLKEQIQQISSLDWSINNSLLSTSFDRSVLVWNLRNNKWEKDLVIMENSRAVLAGEWSPNGNKFAVGGGDHRCFIGYYENENQFWQTRKLSSFKSSVTSVAFHPSGRVVAIGSTDNSISLCTCVLDPKLEDQSYKGSFQNINDFNETLITFEVGGWIEGVAFSPSGNRFCFSVHKGVLQYSSINGEDINEKVQTVQVKNLPIKKLVYANEDTVIGGGYDMKPIVYQYKGDKMEFQKYLENTISETVEVKKSKIAQLQNQLGQQSHKQTAGLHTTPILAIKKYPSKTKNCVSTSDINGSLLLWNV